MFIEIQLFELELFKAFKIRIIYEQSKIINCRPYH